MNLIKKLIKKYAFFRVPTFFIFNLLLIIKSILIVWPPYLFKNPKGIKFFFPWLFSLNKRRSPVIEKTPLIAFEARMWLEKFLRKDMNVFEWGSGGSTLFIAPRVKKIVSVEHDPGWYELISGIMKENKIFNCEYLLKEPKCFENNSFKHDYVSSTAKYAGLSFEDYCRAIDIYPDDFFDFIFIDGRARFFCIQHALQKIRRGGILALDDSEQKRYERNTELLKEWKRKDFFGPRPYKKKFIQMSIWEKP